MLLWLAVATSSLVSALLVTPRLARLATAWGIVDHPDPRKVHRGPVPYLGGGAIVAALAVGLGVGLGVVGLGGTTLPWPAAAECLELGALLLGGVVMFAMGLADDARGLRVRYRLALQLAAASAVYAAGVRVEALALADGWVLSLGAWSYVWTVLWIVGLTNAVNFIDGVDGLASGLCTVASAAIGYVALSNGQYATAVVMVALIGALLGYLPFNWHPARIFLGDSGSLLLGFVLASAAVSTAAKAAAFVGLAVPAIALGVPIIDTAFAVVRRAIERRSVFAPDRQHVHHRLLDLGYHPRRVAVVLVIEAAVATIAAIALLNVVPQARLVVVLGLLTLHLGLFRWCGALRLRDALRLRRTAASEDLAPAGLVSAEWEGRLRDCVTVDDWWRSVCGVAAELGCTALRFQLDRRDGGVLDLRWSADSGAGGEPAAAPAELPVRHRRRGPPLVLAVTGPVDGEVGIRRLAGLLERHSLAELGTSRLGIAPATA
ncbi:MAG: MraY family glycosyltransferase [Planctomycetota bacterium]